MTQIRPSILIDTSSLCRATITGYMKMHLWARATIWGQFSPNDIACSVQEYTPVWLVGSEQKWETVSWSFGTPLQQKLLPGVCFTIFPILGHDIETGQCLAITWAELEGQGLAPHVTVDVPHLTPVAAHREPSWLRSFDLHRSHITRATNVAD